MKVSKMSDLAVVALFLVTLVSITSKPINNASATETKTDTETEIELQAKHIAKVERDTLGDLALAFAMVESSNNPKAYNKSSDATGWLQFKKIMVDEANRIKNINEGTKNKCYFTYDDRWDKDKSEEMFRIVMKHRNPTYSIKKACEIWKYDYGKGYIDAVRKNYKEIAQA